MCRIYCSFTGLSTFCRVFCTFRKKNTPVREPEDPCTLHWAVFKGWFAAWAACRTRPFGLPSKSAALRFPWSPGGQAKALIQGGTLRVSAQAETRRGRKLRTGHVVDHEGEWLKVPGKMPHRTP